MLIKNGTVITPSEKIENMDVRVTNGIITGLGRGLEDGEAPFIDASGFYVCPGFVDIHTHGGFGGDFMDATEEAFDKALAFHSENGTTSVLASSVTAPVEQIENMLGVVRRYKNKENPVCRVLGAHL